MKLVPAFDGRRDESDPEAAAPIAKQVRETGCFVVLFRLQVGIHRSTIPRAHPACEGSGSAASVAPGHVSRSKYRFASNPGGFDLRVAFDDQAARLREPPFSHLDCRTVRFDGLGGRGGFRFAGVVFRTRDLVFINQPLESEAVALRSRSDGRIIEKLKQFIANFVERRFPIAGGCPILNTAVDADDGDSVLRARVSKALKNWLGRLQEFVEEAKEQGAARKKVDAGSVAAVIVSSLEGALMISRLERSDDALRRIQQHLIRYLDAEVATRV